MNLFLIHEMAEANLILCQSFATHPLKIGDLDREKRVTFCAISANAFLRTHQVLG